MAGAHPLQEARDGDGSSKRRGGWVFRLSPVKAIGGRAEPGDQGERWGLGESLH